MTNPTTNVLIPDLGLAAAVREALNLKPSDPIPQKALQELEELTADESSISDLTGLEKATNLWALDPHTKFASVLLYPKIGKT